MTTVMGVTLFAAAGWGPVATGPEKIPISTKPHDGMVLGYRSLHPPNLPSNGTDPGDHDPLLVNLHGGNLVGRPALEFATASARPNPDLLQIAAFIERHQPELQSPGARRRFTRLAHTLAERLTPHAGIGAVWADANQLARSLRDPHTIIYLPDHAGTTLPLLFQTVSGGLAVFATTPQLRHLDGDRVLRIGSFTSGGVLRKLQSLYAGNVYFVQTIAWSDLMSSTALQWLGVMHHGRVPLVLQTASGVVQRVTVPLVDKTLAEALPAVRRTALVVTNQLAAPPGIRFTLRSFYGWAVHPAHNYAVFWLGQCRDTAGYRRAVTAFFQSVRAHHITNVVWDLQNNVGGNALVLYPWLDHIKGPHIVRGYGGSQIIPTRVAPQDQFGGHVYVLVNGGTFSASVMAAEILVANHMATLVGQPPGMGPSGYGNVIQKTVAGLTVQTSTESFPLPGHASRADIRPTIPVPLTMHDVQAGVNPIARWLATDL